MCSFYNWFYRYQIESTANYESYLQYQKIDLELGKYRVGTEFDKMKVKTYFKDISLI